MQARLDFPVTIPDDAYNYGRRASGEAHGVVLTKPHVVELILDLAGYSSKRPLSDMRLLDPACGKGAFLIPAVQRLMQAARRARVKPADLDGAILALDIDDEHVACSREAVAAALVGEGVEDRVARDLAARWVQQGDFLVARIDRHFDAVVGNPPYIRIEQISPILQAEYRARYASIYDRADIYVAFIERGLSLLGPAGVLSFICADRWTLNRYGAPLRKLIADRYHVQTYIDLRQASPFESEVIAYPAIFAIGSQKAGAIRVGRMAAASAEECMALQSALRDPEHPGPAALSSLSSWFEGDEPWALGSPDQLSALRDLEARFPLIESDGSTKVGIGVATGNDGIYIVGADADIEPDRLVPLVMREDIEGGKIRDAQRFVINPFREGSGVVDLKAFPRLARYLGTHEKAIRKRHVAQGRPDAWFRTIDRVYPDLVTRPKLLIPDIAGANEVAFEAGKYHPHHNLYFVTSANWDLEVLGGLLSSRVALFFVWSYAVKMRGGYLRFQAQYLRRIRLPQRDQVPEALRAALKDAFRNRDFARLDDLALVAYGLRELPAFDFVDTRSRR